MNLLSNAIDVLEETWRDSCQLATMGNTNGKAFQPAIAIHTAMLDEDWIEIVIRDNGKGIPAALQPKLFDPFFTTKDVGKGTGLGLSISYQVVVERHGGRMTCHSEPGQGAAFSIQIPTKQRDRSGEAE